MMRLSGERGAAFQVAPKWLEGAEKGEWPGVLLRLERGREELNGTV